MGAGGEGSSSRRGRHHQPDNNEYVVIGAGPVGLLAALGLVQEQGARKVSVDYVWAGIGMPCRRGMGPPAPNPAPQSPPHLLRPKTHPFKQIHTHHPLSLTQPPKVTIYEAREGLTTQMQESYPIGLNPRGVKALDRANPDLALAVRQRGAMVDAWKIVAGGLGVVGCGWCVVACCGSVV